MPKKIKVLGKWYEVIKEHKASKSDAPNVKKAYECKNDGETIIFFEDMVEGVSGVEGVHGQDNSSESGKKTRAD